MEGTNEEKPMEGVEASQPEVSAGKFQYLIQNNSHYQFYRAISRT